MTCGEIEKALPAYLEDALPPGEKKLVGEHIASCPACGSACENLKKASELVGALEEVEPPPWLAKRIMSRVKEEAERKERGFARFFRSFYVKVPVTAFATVMLAVLAFYVYRTGEPEVKRVAPLFTPREEVVKDQAAVASRKFPSTPPAPAAGKISIAKRQAMVEEDKGVTASIADHSTGEAAPAGHEDIRESAASDAAKSMAPIIAAQERSELKAKEIGAYAGSKAREDRTYEAAPSAPGLQAVAAGKPMSIDVTLHVRNASAAAMQVASILDRFKARPVEKKPHNGGEILSAEMKAQDVKEFFAELRKIGDLKEENAALSGAMGAVIVVRTEIVGDR